MIIKFIDFRIFLISLALGLLVLYIYQPSPTTIYVYPTPDNKDKIQYRDKANNCFKFNSVKIKCPANSNNIHTIPMQERSKDS